MATTIIGNPTASVEPRLSAAARMGPSERRDLAIKGIAGTLPLSVLARESEVSRKFVYAQIDEAQRALDGAFPVEEQADEEKVLFQIPVTGRWLRQLVLGVILHCHSSYRGVIDLLQDVIDYDMSVGTVHNIVTATVESARQINAQEDLSPIRVGVQDEIFQHSDPVLVGVDPFSTYCYLLSPESSRDATTWGVRLLELSERGLDLDYTVADAGAGLRSGQALAWPGTECRGDVFHAARDVGQLATYLENRAYGRINTRDQAEQQMRRAKKKGRGNTRSKKLATARQNEASALQLADDVRLLSDWLREDVLALAGPDAGSRRELFDFIVAELKVREHLAPHRIRNIRVALENQREQLLAFAEELDREFLRIARAHGVDPETVRSVLQLARYSPADPRYWQLDSALWKRLGPIYRTVREEVEQVAENTVRASSMVENLNSRLRCYFFLRRQIGPEYLDLLRFFLNNRRYPRSRKNQRAEKSPAEILSGTDLPHWLEQLGFERFRKAA